MGFRSCIVPESDEGESSGDECGSAAAEAASDSESESSLLEQAIRAAGDVCGPSTSAVEGPVEVDPATGLSMEQTYLQFGGGPDPQDDCCSMLDGGRGRGESSDEAASDCETLGSRDTSSSGERDGAYESFIVDEASDDSDSDASWVPEE